MAVVAAPCQLAMYQHLSRYMHPCVCVQQFGLDTCWCIRLGHSCMLLGPKPAPACSSWTMEPCQPKLGYQQCITVAGLHLGPVADSHDCLLLLVVAFVGRPQAVSLQGTRHDQLLVQPSAAYGLVAGWFVLCVCVWYGNRVARGGSSSQPTQTKPYHSPPVMVGVCLRATQRVEHVDSSVPLGSFLLRRPPGSFEG